ncbi:hypothetical protein BGZ60DRAFT_189841 [Tricladium varicosporioides]|nr:hypothetical protein BGZ60DRAFT_189841 [Hymenoscyphus varicosporioides]
MVDRNTPSRQRPRKKQRRSRNPPPPQRRCRRPSSLVQSYKPKVWATHTFELQLVETSTFPGYTAMAAELRWENPYGENVTVFMGLEENEKHGSSTEASSFISVVPDVMSSPCTSSYVIVHRRSNSTGSNHNSGYDSETPLYSLPSQGSSEWVPIEECAVDIDAMEVDSSRSMPHDQNVILFSMCSVEPTRASSPYAIEAATSSGSDISMSQDYVECSGDFATESLALTRSAIPSQRSPQRSPKLHVGLEPPWNHVEPYLAPRYEPGLGVFASSPGPAADQDTNDVRRSTPLSSAAASPRATPPRTMSKSSGVKRTSKTTTREKGNPQWQHAIVKQGKGGVQQLVAESGATPKEQRNGIRRGPLEPKVAEKATGVRRQGACWNCWIQKVPCSIGHPCERCKKHFSPNPEAACSHAKFKDYECYFFPDFLHSHFKKRKIEDLLNEHTSGFTDTTLQVEVAAGACFKPLVVVANVFRPQTWELLGQHRLAIDQENQASRLVLQNSAPVGLLGVPTAELKEKCRDHIEQMIKNKAYPGHISPVGATQIPYNVLWAAQIYVGTSKDSLVQQALMLHAIHYFMKSFLTFSDESARNVYQALQEYGAPQDPYLSSRLLNRQIKYAMHLLSRDITHEVLVGLERAMRTKEKDSWGRSFCAFLVLCLSMEDLEIAADTFVVCDMQKEGANSVYSREQSLEACRNLDNNPFEHCKKLFHDIYRTHRKSQRVDREGGFNPLQNLADGDKGSGLEDPATDAMARAIFKMVCESYPELIELSQHTALVDSSGYEFDTEIIKVNNIGRLVAKFLRSFFPDDWRPPAEMLPGGG